MKHNTLAGRGGCPVPTSNRRRLRGVAAVAVAGLLLSLLSVPASAQSSSNANLSSLTVSPKDIIGFRGSVTSYAVGVASTVAEATLTVAAADSGATVAYDPDDADTVASGHQVDLSAGINTVTITVTAEAGNTKKYRVTIGRGVTDDYGWKASDDLDGLAVEGLVVGGPADIWGNDTTIWVVNTSRPDRHAFAFHRDGTRDRAKDIDLQQASSDYDSPYGMWSDGETVWVANSTGATSQALVAYRLSDGDRLPSRDIVLASDNDAWTGVWSDGRTIWVADSVDDKLFAYRLSDGDRQAGSDFAMHSDNDIPAGIWSDGVTMWVADGTDDKVYAYDWDSGNRVSGRDFNTAVDAGQESLDGIWSDGVTMWIVEGVDEKVYSYNMPTSNNADLRTLAVDGAEVAGFAYNTRSYSSDVADGAVREVTVTAQVRQSAASITSITPTDADPDASGHQVVFADTTSVPVVVTVTAQNGATKAYTLTLSNSSVSEVPVFGHQIGSLSASVDENTAAGTNIVEVSATDPEGAAVNFTLDDDGSRVFEIVAKSGSTPSAYIRTKAPLDYETGSTYAVEVVAADPGGNAASDVVTINVNNVQEPGRVSVSPVRVETGAELTAALSDPDGGVRNVSWQWSRRTTPSDQWSSISGATSAAYTPVQADLGVYLRAVATYTDSLDSGQSADRILSPVLGCEEMTGFGRLVLVGTACVILDTAIVVVADDYYVATAARELERLAGWSVRFQLPGLGMIVAEYSPDNLTLARLNAKLNQIATYPWAARAARDAVAMSTAGASTAGASTAGGAGTSPAVATTVSEPRSVPATLTAEFQNVPASHDGDASFPVRVAFSERIAISFRDFRDHSFTVTSGSVTNVRRVEGRSDLWELTIDPEDDDDVVIVLPGGRSCDTEGAICNSVGTPLSSQAETTIPGPTTQGQQQGAEEEATASPAAPTSLRVSANTGSSVTVTWDDPGDSSITGYQILRRRPREGEDTLLVYVSDTASAATTYTDNNVSANSLYVYRVKAINAAGISDRSNYTRVETP